MATGLADAVIAKEEFKQESVTAVKEGLLPQEDVSFLKMVADDFRALNPAATEEETEQYVKKVIIEHMTKVTSDVYTEDYGYLFGNKLSEVEKNLFDENPSVGADCLYEAGIAIFGYSQWTCRCFPTRLLECTDVR